MKKLISLILAVMMVFSFAATAFAVETVFVPSNGGGNHGMIRARIMNGRGEVLEDNIGEDHLVVTHISEVNTSDEIPDASAAALKDVYAKLTSGAMTLPYAKAGFNAADMTLIDLYDATFTCTEHPEMLQPEGIVIEITFAVPAPSGVDVCVMSYKNGAWVPAENVINHNNGTVSATFEHLCPIAFAVEADVDNGLVDGEEGNPNTGAPVFFGAAALIGAAVLVINKRK